MSGSKAKDAPRGGGGSDVAAASGWEMHQPCRQYCGGAQLLPPAVATPLSVPGNGVTLERVGDRLGPARCLHRQPHLLEKGGQAGALYIQAGPLKVRKRKLVCSLAPLGCICPPGVGLCQLPRTLAQHSFKRQQLCPMPSGELQVTTG